MQIACVTTTWYNYLLLHEEAPMHVPRAVKLTLCASALLSAAVISYSALAWTWNRWVPVFRGPGLCVQGEAGIDHWRPGSFSGNLAYSGAFARDQACINGLTGRWAATRVDVYKDQAICRGTEWKYDYTGLDSFGSPIGPSIVFNYGGPASCGRGWYGTYGAAFVWDGSAWKGGWVWSGWEWVE
jgi:hypothetical protein